MALAKPLLEWVSEATDNTPLFEPTFTNFLAGDIAKLQLATDAGFTANLRTLTITSSATQVRTLVLPLSSTALTNVQWWARIRHERGAEVSAWSDAVTKTVAAETTAPTLSNPADNKTGATTASGSVDTDEGNGFLYAIISTSATPPTKAQVRAGKMHTDAAAAAFVFQEVEAAGTQLIIGGWSGLTLSTTYYAHYMHEDNSGNQSDVVSGDGFTTDATEFSPTDIASLWSWIDPAVNSFQTISGTTAATADGDSLGYLTDKSGNGRHWIAPANNTTRPTLQLAEVNGKPVIRFVAGSSQYLACNASLAAFTQGEVFAVIKKTADPQGNGINGLWKLGTDGSGDHLTYSDGNAYLGTLSSARKSTGNPTVDMSTAFRLVDIWSAASDFAVNIDGASHYTTATNTVAGTSAPLLGASSAGGGTLGSQDVAEFLIFSAKLSGTDRTSMKDYLSVKYGLTVV